MSAAWRENVTGVPSLCSISPRPSQPTPTPTTSDAATASTGQVFTARDRPERRAVAARTHQRGERGLLRDRLSDLRGALGGELTIRVRAQIVVGKRQSGAHLITLKGVAGLSAFIRRSFSRARFSRDITVPIGTLCTRAMSS